MLNLREYRLKIKGLPDLLNYAMLIDRGVILNKDGSFLTGYRFYGPDLEAAGDTEMAALSNQISAAITRNLGSGWILNVDAIRIDATDYPECQFPHPVLQLIEDERKQQYRLEGAHYVTEYRLFLTYLPPPDIDARFVAILKEGEEKNKRDYGRFLTYFKDQSSAFTADLSVWLNIAPLDDDDLLTAINACITGEYHPLKTPAHPVYLDAILGSDDLTGGMNPRLGNRWIGVMAIDNYPLESWPGIMDAMNHIPLNYRWSNRFIALDQVEAEAILKRYRRNWWQKRQSVFSLIREETKLMGGGGSAFGDSDAVRMAQDADEAVADNSAGIVKFGYHTSVMIFFDENRANLDDALREAKKRVQAMGFNARIETVNAVEAYLGSLPGHGIYNVRRPIVNSANLSDMLPITSIWPGEAYNPNPFYPPNSPPLFYAGTSGHTPFRFNIHVGDLGHTLVLGPTGAGKSTLLGLIAAQFFRYKNAQVFAFDKGYSMMPLALAAGGEHYDIGGDNDETAFCPLSRIDRNNERDWAAEYIETLFQLMKVNIDPRKRQIIYRSLELLAQSPSKTMTDFLGTLKDDADMREALSTYTIGGSLGSLLDAKADTIGHGNFQVFEMEHLMNRGEKATVPVLQYLFHAIERRLDGRPTLILLDEAWIYLSHDMFREKIREWLKVLRKANAAVIFSTQSVSDIARSPIRDVILESTPVKVYLANPEARTEVSRESYRAFGLSDHQIELVANMTKKRHYFYVSTEGRRIINLELKKVALSFIGASGRDDLKRILELYKEHGPSAWPYYWLKERDLADWAEYFNNLSKNSH